jgi:hypothetical protein
LHQPVSVTIAFTIFIFFVDVDRKGTPTAQTHLPTADKEAQQLCQKPYFIDEIWVASEL